MHPKNNIIKQLIINNIEIRNKLLLFCNNRILCNNTEKGKNSYATLYNVSLGLLVKKNIQKAFLMKNESAKEIYIEGMSHNPPSDVLSLLAKRGVITNTQLCYHLIYWGFFFNPINSNFRKKKKSIESNFNTPLNNLRRFVNPVNKTFTSKFKFLKKKKSFIFSQPLLSFLSKKNKISPLLNNVKMDLFAVLFSFYINNLISVKNKTKKNTSLKSVNARKIRVPKTSKVIFAINQFILNSINMNIAPSNK